MAYRLCHPCIIMEYSQHQYLRSSRCTIHWTLNRGHIDPNPERPDQYHSIGVEFLSLVIAKFVVYADALDSGTSREVSLCLDNHVPGPIASFGTRRQFPPLSGVLGTTTPESHRVP